MFITTIDENMLYKTKQNCRFALIRPCLVGLVVSVSVSHTVCREFASRPGHNKDHHKNGIKCLLAWHAMC